MEGARGFMGVAGREWVMYQANTVRWSEGRRWRGRRREGRTDCTFVTVFCGVGTCTHDGEMGGGEEGFHGGFHCDERC